MLKSVALVLLVAALPKLLEYACQKHFAVHAKGGIVVTGASSGIGQHAVSALTAQGFTVFAGVRKQADADRLEQSIPGVVPLLLDVTDQGAIDRAQAKVAAKLSSMGLPLVALVNNAGVQKDLPVELQSPATDRWTFDVNVFGLMDTTRAFIPLLRATGDGARIINIGSLAGLTSCPGSATYGASKYAVEGFTDSLRLELEHFGISVSLLQPGYVFTGMGVKLHDGTKNYGVSDEQYALYQHVFNGFFKTDQLHASKELAAPTSVVTDAIVDAITSPVPKTRYLVANVGPFPAALIAWIKNILPDRVYDLLQD